VQIRSDFLLFALKKHWVKMLFIKLTSVSDTGSFSFHSGGHNRFFRCSCWSASWGNFNSIPFPLYRCTQVFIPS